MNRPIVFCVSCRLALGKLRRSTNIAAAIRKIDTHSEIVLLADSGPVDVSKALPEQDLKLFDRIEKSPVDEMTSRLKSNNTGVVVVETMRVRNLHELDARLCLILREVMTEQLPKFRLINGRQWDLVIIPNPADGWRPDPDTIQTKRIEPVGWIYRADKGAADEGKADRIRTILVTTGGGGGEDRGNDVHSIVENLLQQLAPMVREPYKVMQVVGPQARKNKRLNGVDEIIEPGPELHRIFAAVDLVISAAGYNSVLELATTDVPVLLVPVPRYSDDQEKRAKEWEKDLGRCYSSEDQGCVQWMAEIVNLRKRRRPVPIGPSGADRAAELILSLRATRL